MEECFKRIARTERGNGRVKGSDDFIEGLKIFKKDILGKKNLALFKMEDFAQRLFYMNAFKTIDDAREFCRNYSFQQEIEYGNGILYFERKGNRIAVGYSA